MSVSRKQLSIIKHSKIVSLWLKALGRFGFPDPVEARKIIENREKSLRRDPNDYPITPEQAFSKKSN